MARALGSAGARGVGGVDDARGRAVHRRYRALPPALFRVPSGFRFRRARRLPPLAGNPALEDATHVRSVIEKGLSGPLEVGGQSFNGTMPPFGGQLTDAEVQALTDYVRSAWGNAFGTPSTDGAGAGAPAPAPGSERSAAASPAPVPAQPANAGDAVAGRALFAGSRRFQNRAPPCSACHTVQGENPLGGGTMGRDLTTAYDRLGQSAGLQGVLTSIAFPVMRQAFANHALTPSEIADLVAYLRQSAATAHEQGTANRDPSRFGFNWLWLFGAAGAALLFAVLLTGWPRQREGVAERLRRTARLGRHRR